MQLIIGGHTTHLQEIMICCFVFLPEGENGLSCQVSCRKTPCQKHSISDSNETPIYGTWDMQWDDRMHPSACAYYYRFRRCTPRAVLFSVWNYTDFRN
ncbi:hypothetical protein CLOSTMETH_03552 [[Clostridium] methylpentosum DSM 5476]|uniref:Uncharacterized protein n=1 Tax=[Clostridium] methylpentosum DSM 5476 TaxID=537013 RepID=C0EI57_9FIRM|nr:hypothetical protein CLOSTMETH_03552 [[Clostridium] methylpentosum DSM 5476]